MASPATVETPAAAATGSSAPQPVFGVNEVRLTARQWLAALIILASLAWLVPYCWEHLERFETGPDYRIPYELSKDYWLYARRLHRLSDTSSVVLLGDSVVWGEYVLPDGTLSHFLNQQYASGTRFVNGGLNGLFPLAEEGLVKHYAAALHNRKIILQCNLLWMTSPKADLSTDKEEQFNHSRLVPQFFPRIPCYRAGVNERLSVVIENHVEFFSWVAHLQNAYFGQKSILAWTLEDDGGSPAVYPNASRNPFAQITMKVPVAPLDDPQRGPQSPRHRPWSSTGQGTAQFEWVSLESSLQWQGFRKTLATLRDRGNDVFVLLGPFNEHMMASDNLPAYRKLQAGIMAWLKENRVPSAAPPVLPSELYADASHPLTKGYELLAQQLLLDESFSSWLKK